MLLTKLKIKNFRSYSNQMTTEIRFSNGINTILGKNNVGKSAIFKALSFLKGDISDNQEDHFTGESSEPAYVELSVLLGKSEIRSIIESLIKPPYNK